MKVRRRSITPFPAEVSNPIIARVLTDESEHASLGRVTRASEKRRKERSQRICSYDEQQEVPPLDPEGDEWMDPEKFCDDYILLE